MGGHLVIFLTGSAPNPPILENPVALKFLRPIRLLDSFTQNFLKKTFFMNSFFVWHFGIMVETYRKNLGN